MPDLNRIRLLWVRISQTLWWRPAVWSAAAVGAAFASALAEIAQRALSPVVNDPGTEIAVPGRQTRRLIQTFGTPQDADAKVCDRVTATAP